MAKDLLYTNGVIAAKEKYLLKDKIFRLCEGSAEEAFRVLTESGFGKGADAYDENGYEKLIAADEEEIDAFIREYSPSRAEAEYLLAPRDFHNAKAIVKSRFTGLDVKPLLAPSGLIPVKEISDCIESGRYDNLGKTLGGAVKEAAAAFEEESGKSVSGAELGAVFDKALYKHLSEVCAKNRTLKKLIAAKADMTNILTALRSASEEFAQKYYLTGGKLTKKQLSVLFSEDAERAEHALDGTEYAAFLKSCVADRAEGRPFTLAENINESYEARLFAAKKYELQKNQPFLYYVFRRRAENADVRILFVCLLAGMKEGQIKSRLRAVL